MTAITTIQFWNRMSNDSKYRASQSATASDLRIHSFPQMPDGRLL
jgi:hypothetical protein